MSQKVAVLFGQFAKFIWSACAQKFGETTKKVQGNNQEGSIVIHRVFNDPLWVR